MFEWYDKHFKDIVLNPANKPETKTKTYPDGTVIISTSDPAVLKNLKAKVKHPHVIAVSMSEKQIGLRDVKSITLKVSAADLI